MGVSGVHEAEQDGEASDDIQEFLSDYEGRVQQGHDKESLELTKWNNGGRLGPFVFKIAPIFDCWIVTSHTAKGKDDYPRAKWDGKWTQINRIFWRSIVKTLIPPGKMVLHSCDNPLCVNPEHLRIGTAKENSQDMKDRGRLADQKGEKNGNAKLTDAQVEEIKTLIKNNPKLTNVELAKRYGVTHQRISQIRKLVRIQNKTN